MCGHGTFQPILQLYYRWWLTLHQAIQRSSIYSYPKLEFLLILSFSLINSPDLSCFCLVGWFFFLFRLKNSRWKHHMKKWWLRSYSRSGHVWISNSYPAGLSWKICPECSIFQWVSWLIVGLLSAHIFSAPVLSTGQQTEKAEETFLWLSSLFGGLQESLQPRVRNKSKNCRTILIRR